MSYFDWRLSTDRRNMLLDKIDLILSESNLIEELDKLEQEQKKSAKKTKNKNPIRFPKR